MVSLIALLALSPEILHGLPLRTIVLTYHDVIECRDAKSLWFDCTTAELKAQLDWMEKHGAHFISLSQLHQHLVSGTPLPSHPVAITFADNYLGYYLRAWPEFRRRHIPSAMFVHTGFVGSRVGRPKMTWDQLTELDRSGLVTVGSQTVSHTSVTTLPPARVRVEFADSKRDLERHLGHAVAYLAYPNGSFDDSSARVAGATWYLMAFTERLNPAEGSPSIFEVARYVHTRYRQAWKDANR